MQKYSFQNVVESTVMEHKLFQEIHNHDISKWSCNLLSGSNPNILAFSENSIIEQQFSLFLAFTYRC